MKNLIIITILIIASNLQINAQKEPYIPILTDSLHWWAAFVAEGSTGCQYHEIVETQLYNDTIYYSNGGAWYVEDTTTKRIYAMSSSNFEVANRHLMYDFSLNEGDSIWLPDYISAYHWFFVDSIRYINTYAGNRKAWYLHFDYDDEDTEHPIWVEGIGSLAGFYQFNTEPGMWYSGQGLLTCFYQGNSLIYEHELAQQYDCLLTGYLDIEEKTDKIDIKVFPNPANEIYTIKFIENYNSAELTCQIFDIFGRCIKNYSFYSEEINIDTKDYPMGLYFYKILKKSRIIYKDKFIIKH